MKTLCAILLLPIPLAAQVTAQGDLDLPVQGTFVLAPQDTTLPPPDFVAVDKPPVIVKPAEPAYPELAKRAGIEGIVWVKVWVDQHGKPRQATILKSDAEIFNQPSLDAARKFEFTPAVLDGKPVSVWVSVPFKYKLSEKPSAPKNKALPGDLSNTLDCIGALFAWEEGGQCEGRILPDAQIVIGSEYAPLHDALTNRGKPGGFPDERSKEIKQIVTTIDDSSTMATLVIGTGARKGNISRYHTIVCLKSKDGTWKIKHWHTSR